MSTIKYIRRLLLATLLLTVVNTALYAEYYRWVDDDGKIHYSDNLPPAEAQRKQDILNEQGRTIETIPAPKTLSELEEEKKLAEIEAEKQRKKEQAEKRDRNLLALYNNVDDIEYIRDERIATVQSAIDITNLRKKKFKKKLRELEQQEVSYHEKGQETPAWLKKSRSHFLDQLANVNELLKVKEREKLQIKKRFSGEINRYLELKEPALAVQ